MSAEHTTDDLLREALVRLYPPADGAGVADAVRSRVAAGETGTTPPSSRASWLPWIAGAVVVGLLAGGAGAAGLFGHPAPPIGDDAATVPVVTVISVDAAQCPAGAVVGTIPAGSRVLALQRSADDGWIAVGDPFALGATLWVPTSEVVPETGQPALSSLPVGDCGATEIVVEAAAPAPVAPVPVPGDETPTTPDATAPTLSAPTVGYSPAQGFVCTEQPSSVALVAVTASDDVGVASVVATWGGSQPGSAPLSPSGGQWSLSYRPTNLSITESIPFTLIATDAAGNPSAPVGVSVARDQCPG